MPCYFRDLQPREQTKPFADTFLPINHQLVGLGWKGRDFIQPILFSLDAGFSYFFFSPPPNPDLRRPRCPIRPPPPIPHLHVTCVLCTSTTPRQGKSDIQRTLNGSNLQSFLYPSTALSHARHLSACLDLGFSLAWLELEPVPPSSNLFLPQQFFLPARSLEQTQPDRAKVRDRRLPSQSFALQTVGNLDPPIGSLGTSHSFPRWVGGHFVR